MLVAALCELKARGLLPAEDEGESRRSTRSCRRRARRAPGRVRPRAGRRGVAGRAPRRGRAAHVPQRAARAAPAAHRRATPCRQRGSGRRCADAIATPARAAAARSTCRTCRGATLPVRGFLDRTAALLDERGTFTFDEAVDGLDRVGSRGRVLGAARALPARRGARGAERSRSRRSASRAVGLRRACRRRRDAAPSDGRREARGVERELHARTVEALLFVASGPLTRRRPGRGRRAGAPRAGRARARRARRRHSEGRAAVVLEEVAGGYGLSRAASATRRGLRAPARPRRPTGRCRRRRSRRWPSWPTPGRCRAPRSPASAASPPTAPSPRLLERGLIEEAGRGDTPGAPVLYRTTVVFDRVFWLEDGLRSLPSLDELEARRRSPSSSATASTRSPPSASSALCVAVAR